MSAVRQFACEVCHAVRQDSESWLVVPGETWGPALHILPWDDQLAAESGVYHFCGPHHAKEMISLWFSTGYLETGPRGIVWTLSKRASEVHDWQISPRPERHIVSRFPGAIEEADPETLLAMIDVLETLRDSSDEDTLCEVFDA